MKKKFLVGAMMVLLFSTYANFPIHAEGQRDYATWLWNPWMIVHDEMGTLDFLETKQANKVYLQIDRDIPMQVYRNFIEKASAKEIKIYALDGAPDWVGPKGSTHQNKLLNWVGNYQSGSADSQKFSGIHLDVEPYLYHGWSTNQAATIRSYQTLLLKAKTSAASLKLPLEVDLPFWFDEIYYKNKYGKGNLAEWAIANTDGITIMAYRDTASFIIDIVKNEIAFADKHGKNVIIGVETGRTDEGDQISFFEEGEAYMMKELTSVNNYYDQVKGYNGIAIHHVESWMNMKQ
ncbi:amidase [Sutcliffiella deserti]|uniref:amidase n=1 Tax=Sutcliffiella deserti TaxID=2875501 RepID=UPI001CC19D48|nr:amidase [Sutcliffiella deserti]